MDRIKSFDATGVAPNGRLYAGDLNLLQDTVAALTDFAQNLSVSSLAVGAADTTLTHYGAQEMAVSGLMRVLGVFRAASGIVVGSYTTAQRDAIVNPAYGLVILNQTTNKYEWNSGTPAVPVWSQLGGSPISRGAFGAMPAPSATNVNTIYLATDQNGGTAYYSDGTTWTQLAAGVSSTSSFTQVVGDGATTSFAIAHNLGTQNVIVQVRQNAAPFSLVEPEIQVTNNNSVTVVFDTAPTAGQYAVTVIGGIIGAANTPAAHASSHAAGGSDSLPWGTIHGMGTFAAMPPAAAVNSGYRYYATDFQGGTEFQSNGVAWIQIGSPRKPAGCRLTHSVDQNIANTDVLTLLSWDTELYDNGGCHSPGDNSKIVCPAGEDGLWHFHFMHVYPGTPTKFRAAFLKNGTDYPREEYWGAYVGGGMDALIYLAAGDYVQVQVAQVSGTNPYAVKSMSPVGQTESPVFAAAHVA